MHNVKKVKKIRVNLSKIHKFRSYDIFGSHETIIAGVKGVRFALWAPNAVEVTIAGSFNNWSGDLHKMKKNKKLGIWTFFIEGLKAGDIYKYEIVTPAGKKILKSDPYAFYSELRPNTASKVTVLHNYQWEDTAWLEKRAHTSLYDNPVNVYELHLASWKMDNGDFLNYRQIADELSSYIIEMGYTHVELLPVSEHPLDASWGYQSTGYFAVTSRFGTPEDFMYFVDKMHSSNIGVILDWVPGHFCKDLHGLYSFDGTRLYEYENPLIGENYDWGTANFDLGKAQVRQYLISNALFWFDKYHIDGLRVDAVANMLYLDYGKKENMQLRNKFGGNENLEAIDFLKKLNSTIFRYFPNALMIAEDSSSFPGVTTPAYLGGLGFNYKWNMGWMNDMLKYMQMDPIHRKWHHNLITFSLMYAFSENFVLPLSHDEVVHGKKSLLDKMPGDYWQRFASLRMFYGYMLAHPGKKLLFMGGEIGQFIEWKFDAPLDWFLLDYPMHKSMQCYVKALNSFYRDESSLWQIDHSYKGFQWIDHQNYEQSIISFMRIGKKKDDFIIVISNFTPVVYHNYKIGVPSFIHYKEVFNSDSEIYGGSNQVNGETLKPELENWHNQLYHIKITIPPLATIFIKPEHDYRLEKQDNLQGGNNHAEERNDSNDTGRGTGQ
jgi:1,4-alpha-glucan branching enzyme